MGVSKNEGVSPKMDGENNGKPPKKMDDFGGTPIFGNTQIFFPFFTVFFFFKPQVLGLGIFWTINRMARPEKNTTKLGKLVCTF